MDELEQNKKKSSREMEALQNMINELQNNNVKLEKTKKRLQNEVSVLVLPPTQGSHTSLESLEVLFHFWEM